MSTATTINIEFGNRIPSLKTKAIKNEKYGYGTENKVVIKF